MATTRESRRRGPSGRQGGKAPAQAGLSRERIMAAALELVQAEGLAGFSTRKLGERLGCEAMSIYHHFAGRAQLMDALVDHAIASFEWPPETLAPLPRLRALMHAYRAMAHRFPALFPLVALHRLNTETGVRFIEGILRAVEAVVPDRELAARHFRTLGYYLIGAGLDETAGYARGPSAVEPVSDEFIARECPHLVAASRYFKPAEWDRTFELGVESLLASLDSAALQGHSLKS
ncbi:TetR/AcrR family transcriptional regulator [Pelomonas sp. KK5]|uniref:TetR/AcrR family transcriptional regulator n=1 Tax=Pelomonas sp. KK5 TaxID=1855730 RepID=UPI0009FB2F29|nr:TetR/AcrR family transcriptional regulator [Pelomonas sp. KK5]